MTAPTRRSTGDPFFPSDDEYLGLLDKRTRRARTVQLAFLGMLTIAVLGLAILLYTIIDDSFGLVAVVNQNEPEDVIAALGHDPATTALGDLSKDELITALRGSINNNVGRRLEREQRFHADRLAFETQEKWDEICAPGAEERPDGCDGGERSAGNVLLLVEERVIQPDVVAVNGLTASILDPDTFRDSVRTGFSETPERFGDYTLDQVRFQWRAWFSWRFVTSPASATPEIAGIRTIPETRQDRRPSWVRTRSP